MNTDEFVMRVLTAFAARPNELCDMLTWRVDGDFAPVSFLVDCSDTFEWGTADSEPITSETIGDLEQAISDVRAATVHNPAGWVMYVMYAPLLYAARRRGQRPMRAAYPKDEALWPLFDACGPDATESQS